MIDTFRRASYYGEDDESMSPGRDNQSSKLSEKELKRGMDKLAVMEKKFKAEKFYKED